MENLLIDIRKSDNVLTNIDNFSPIDLVTNEILLNYHCPLKKKIDVEDSADLDNQECWLYSWLENNEFHNLQF